MLSARRLRSVVLLVAMAGFATGCEYYSQAFNAARDGEPVPWFCDPVAPNSVTGPGMGSVNFYAGVTRSPHDYDTCKTVAGQFDKAKAYAEQYPTLGAAEAAGFNSTFAFIPGMGTHHGLGSITPELLVDPTFDRHEPIIPDSIIDETFDPAQPEFLQYNGNGANAVLVGMSYYVRTDDGLPPEGFAGDNDWWHHHPTLCLAPATAQAFAANTTDAQCTSRGGVNLYMDDYYMLHVWLVDDLEYEADVHAPMHPCIKAGGAVFDMDDPCHDEWAGGGFPTAAVQGVDGTDADAGRSSAPGATHNMLTCPLGLGNEDLAPA